MAVSHGVVCCSHQPAMPIAGPSALSRSTTPVSKSPCFGGNLVYDKELVISLLAHTWKGRIRS